MKGIRLKFYKWLNLKKLRKKRRSLLNRGVWCLNSFYFFSCTDYCAVRPQNSFWHEDNGKILSKIKSCRSLSLTYCDVIVGSFEEEMDLFNYIVILGKSFSWTCRCKETLPSLSHFIRILLIKYETEKHIHFKSDKKNLFKEKWKIFEENILTNN